MQYKIKEKQKISMPENAARIFQEILKATEENDQEKEHFWSMGLNTRNIVQYVELVSMGILTAALVHPRETFRMAIQKGKICGIVICHNHPCGDSQPSMEDIALTQRMVEAGNILGIDLLDHIIITRDSFLSLKSLRKGGLK